MVRGHLLEEQLISRSADSVEKRDKGMGHALQQRFLQSVPLRVAVAQLLETLCYKPQGSIPKNVIGNFH